MSKFDLQSLKDAQSKKNRYCRRIAYLRKQGMCIDSIKSVVEESMRNVNNGTRSFVIYGEPQSGKTDMMIALTGRLLDEGFKIVIVLLNDSVQLLSQNLERFHESKIDPAPKKFTEVLPTDVKIGDKEWIIFCKKNANDLRKLIDKLGKRGGRVIIDDEADYATPNSKVNKQKQSRINELTTTLIGEDGVYIGVTATPARLDLNRTHENENESWVDFPPHPYYTGREKFFPADFSTRLPYNLTLIPDGGGDNPVFLRDALFSFLVNVGYLNTQKNKREVDYSMLVHTSGKKADHSIDYKQIIKIFEVLADEKDKKHKKYYKKIYEIAEKRFPDAAEKIVTYVLEHNSRHNAIVMNSDKEVNAADHKLATKPVSPFTIVVGGNIVSRGVTFENLLSMFFTRDVKHKMQQDTYIQRARMFGSRGEYLRFFELTIPNNLYLDWHKCFVFHHLSLQSRRKENKSPVWLEDKRVSAVAAASVKKTAVAVDSGEMSFELFNYDQDSIHKVMEFPTNLDKLRALNELLGNNCFPDYLIEYVENFLPDGENSIAFHEPKSISGYKSLNSEDKKNVRRSKGFIGKREREEDKFPNAIHHIVVLFNDSGNARVFYKYHGNIRFVKTVSSI